MNKKGFIILLIFIIVYFSYVIPKYFLGNTIVYLGSNTKVIVGNKIKVKNNIKNIGLKKVNIYFDKKFIDGYIKTESNGNIVLDENGNKLYSVDGLIAYEGKNEIKVANSKTISSTAFDNNLIIDFMADNKITGVINYSIKNDINSKISVYDVLTLESENKYTSFNILSNNGKLMLVNKVDGNYDNPSKLSTFYKMIDFDNDGSYEIVIKEVNNNTENFKIYSYSNDIKELGGK